MRVTYTVRIKPKHDAPEFKEGMGKGVISIQEVEFPTISKDDLDTNAFKIGAVVDHCKKLLNEFVECTYKIEEVD